MNGLASGHLLEMEGFPKEDALRILDAAETFMQVNRRSVRKVPTLRGKTIINMFFEASTRTRSSFEIAGKRMSADVINFSGSTSSTSKGETLRDTIKTMGAMNPHVIVIRHEHSGAARHATKHTTASIVNAGDGMHEHPTQALLDAFTIQHHKKRLDGLRIAICGDIAHSRVARSDAYLFRTLGAEVVMAGPRTLLPVGLEQALGVTVHDRVEPALEGADVIMALRIQKERLGGALIPSNREYSQRFGINPKRVALAKADCLVMHPGPINRGVEIEPVVADGAASVILDQVEAGVAVRMAVLWLLSAEQNEPLPA
jgi:aspartate carbamoyltransferase catalytic subunit